MKSGSGGLGGSGVSECSCIDIDRSWSAKLNSVGECKQDTDVNLTNGLTRTSF